LILWCGYKFSTVTYERVEREYGKSRWTFGKKVKYFIDAFVGFSYLPLRLSAFLGLFFAMIGGMYSILVVFLRLFNEVPVQGWTTLTVIVLLLSGVQLFILGILGEYLWRNLDAARSRPMFIVDKIIQ
jgi:polyisoprenyl-phosphate glycosyltransferase